MKSKICSAVLLVMATTAGWPTAFAQQKYPVRPIRVLIPGFENLGWWALMAPAGTPKPVIEKIQRDVVKMLHSPDVRARLDQLGMDPIGNSPADFARQLRQESGQWAKIVRERGLQVN